MKKILKKLTEPLQIITLVIVFILASMLVMSQSCHQQEIDEISKSLTHANAAIYDYEVVENENITLRKLLREREEPIILTKPEYIIQTQVKTVEVEKIVKVPVSAEAIQYDYKWDSGLCVAHYSYDGYEHVFTTPKIDFTMETEVGDELSVTRVYATSSSDLSRRVLLDSATHNLRVRENVSESLQLPPWAWVTIGAVSGIGATAGSVWLAGQIDE